MNKRAFFITILAVMIFAVVAVSFYLYSRAHDAQLAREYQKAREAFLAGAHADDSGDNTASVYQYGGVTKAPKKVRFIAF